MGGSMIKNKLAKLNEAQIKKVKKLEESLGQDVQVIVVEKQTMYVLEAKTEPKHWVRIKDVYPDADLSSFYSTREEAKTAKSMIKFLLHGKWKKRFDKYPIRIRETL